jgi:hypothetical protein
MMKLKFIACLLVLLTFISCDEECDDFCPGGPYFSDLYLFLTINNENPEVDIVIFNGRLERGDTVLTETVTGSTTFELVADRYYSVTARYKQGNKEIVAINGKELKMEENDCGCKRAKNYTMNLVLKD